MKLVTMKCPNCGAMLKIDKDKETAVCQYCNQSFYIDDEKSSAPFIQINIEKSEETPFKSASAGTSTAAGKIVAIVIFIFAAIIMFTAFGAMHGFNNGFIFESDTDASGDYRSIPESTAMCEFSEKIFGKHSEEITEKEYSSIKAIKLDKNLENNNNSEENVPWTISYAFEVDDDGIAGDMKEIVLSATESIDLKDLQAFRGLENIVIGNNGDYSWNYDDYTYSYDFTNLKNIKRFYINEPISRVENAFANPERILAISANIYDDNDLEILKKFTGIKSLNMPYISHSYINNLEFLTVFRNLRSLNIGFNVEEKWDLSPLSALVNLRELTINGLSADLQGIEVLKGMPMLETLQFDNVKQLRTLDFVNNMPHLDKLSINHSPINDITPLKNKLSLQYFSLTYCDEVTDISAVSTLSNLKKFEYDKYSGIPSYAAINNVNLISAKIPCNMLNMLSGASNLEELTLTGSNENADTSLLPSFKKLKNLNFKTSALVSYSTALASQISASSAESVKGLASHLYDSLQEEQDANPVFADSGISSLIFPDYSDTTTYTAFEISLSKMQNNNKIKVLDISNCYMRNIDENGERNYFVFELKPLGTYADEFLKHFKAVEELKVTDSHLNDIEFVRHMPNLKSIDLSNNYVQDLSPLKACPKLEKVICRNNAVSNANVLSDKITIIQ